MIIPPVTRDYPLHPKGETSNKSSFGLQRMLTPIFFPTAEDEMEFYNGKSIASTDSSLTQLATSSYANKNNFKFSLLAGIFQGLGGSAVAAEALRPSSLARLAVPAFLAFETHFCVSNALYEGVFQEEKQSKFQQAHSSNPIGIFENVLNYELHIVAGATAGLVYSVAHTSMLQDSLATSQFRAKTATKMLGFAALFGGYDFYSDVFGSLLAEEDQPASSSSNMATIGLAGGFASMTQASILGLRRNMVSTRMQFASETAARYACATTTVQTSSAKQLVRAFVPGAAAFLVYERFGTLMNGQ